MVKNSLVKKFKDEDLQLIIDNNAYHSPEESETDCENGRSNIIVKDLKWRSDTLRLFLREYIDRLRTEQPNNRKLRERTRSGYKGKLKIAVTQQLDQRQDQQYDLMKFAESEKSFNDGYDADVGEGEEEMEETVLLTSTDQPSNQSSNQPSNQSSDQSSNQQPSDQSSNQQPSGQSSNQPSGQPSDQLSDDDYLEMDD
ncbi:TonB-dependent receptor [Rhizophagus irregularis DAOM 181602=DAOM 197198]|nr:TonB-dependent receptor [Rhizophagus irregularis DAOM 181602=DAOM 197198]